MNLVKIYISDINKYDDQVFFDMIDKMRDIKEFNYNSLSNHIKESVLAWFIVYKYALDNDIQMKILYGDYFKPYFKDENCFFNISHSGGKVSVAFSNYEIGMDMEKITTNLHRRIYNRVLSKNEIRSIENNQIEAKLFTRLWTLKESSIKLSGLGLSEGINNYSFDKYLNINYFYAYGHFYYSKVNDEFIISVSSDESFYTEITDFTF